MHERNDIPALVPTPTEGSIERSNDTALKDRRLDAELEQTFPASDPVPWRHDAEA